MKLAVKQSNKCENERILADFATILAETGIISV